ncbi:GIY-YIG nuclease family protein [Candidatus Parcubacteria bacterium]|nr:GIY-YIG nuclease family protein [Candidatus Parcubacteria bacterium]
MKLGDLKQFNLPDVPGVYFFKNKKVILYVGKATSLQDRIKSYFSKDIFVSRGPRIVKMLEEATVVEYMQTDSVLEALILEANEIKKHQPIYNAREKDDKSYNFVTITKEDFPKIVITRGSGDYGPFPHAGELRAALKIIRKIFPFRDEKCKIMPGKSKPCFNAQIGLCPGPCAGRISKADYRKQIRKIKLFFEAKKPELIRTLEREMQALAKAREFEKAEEVKRKLFALDHIQDVALIKADMGTRNPDRPFRIEAYDIAHLSGTNVVGVMTVVEDGEVAKSQYRKFKIKADKNDDTKNLKEVLNRRLNHPEWPMPQLVAVDGGVGQLNAAREVLKERGFDIEVVSVVKDERHKAKEVLNLRDGEFKRPVLLANSEAHRFAIGYHRRLRGKGFRI